MKHRSAIVLALFLVVTCCWQSSYAQGSMTHEAEDFLIVFSTDPSRVNRFLESGFGNAESRINPATGTAYMVIVDESELQKRALGTLLIN